MKSAWKGTNIIYSVRARDCLCKWYLWYVNSVIKKYTKKLPCFYKEIQKTFGDPEKPIGYATSAAQEPGSKFPSVLRETLLAPMKKVLFLFLFLFL